MGWTGYRTQVKIRFQEILAVAVIAPFLYFTAMAIFKQGDLEVLRIYAPLVLTILGGYFGQGAIREYRQKNPGIDVYDEPGGKTKKYDFRV